MMRDNQDIKDQIKKMRDLVNNNNSIVKEHIQEIKKTYLFEQSEPTEVENIATTQKTLPDFPGTWHAMLDSNG